MNNTSIEWCRTYAADGGFTEGFSVNPIRFRPHGSSVSVTMCQKVSPRCAYCYAEQITRRFWPKDALVQLEHPNGLGLMTQRGFPGYTALGVSEEVGEFFLDESKLMEVLKRRKPCRIFWGDMTDLFGDWVKDEWLDRIFAVCALTPHLTHIFLTKRAERMRDYLRSEAIRDGGVTRGFIAEQYDRPARFFPSQFKRLPLNQSLAMPWPLPNVGLGVWVENQEQADKRITLLLQTPAAVRFISAEPLLGPVDLGCIPFPVNFTRSIDSESDDGFCALRFDDCNSLARLGRLDWVIVGGESGKGAGIRPMHPDWVRSLRDQCVAADVPFFFKQWGEWGPDAGFQGQKWMPTTPDGRFAQPATGFVYRVGKKAAGDLLDGKQWHPFPVGHQ